MASKYLPEWIRKTIFCYQTLRMLTATRKFLVSLKFASHRCFTLCNLDLGVHSTLHTRQQSSMRHVDTLTYQLPKPHLPQRGVACANYNITGHRLYASPIYAWIRTESCFLFFWYLVLHQLSIPQQSLAVLTTSWYRGC